MPTDQTQASTQKMLVSTDGKEKMTDLVAFPTYEECDSAHINDRLNFEVIFAGKDYPTDIPLYVTDCWREASQQKVRGTTGAPGSGQGLRIEVVYSGGIPQSLDYLGFVS